MWIETLIEEINAAVLIENGKLECYRGNYATVYFFCIFAFENSGARNNTRRMVMKNRPVKTSKLLIENFIEVL